MQTLNWDTASLSSTTLRTVGLLECCLLILSSTISFLFFLGFWNRNKGVETTGCSVVGQRDRTDCLLKVSGRHHSTRLCSVSLFCLHFATFSWQIQHLSKTSSLPSLSLSVYSPLPLLFIQVNDFIQLSDFVRTWGQGLSWAQRKGRTQEER